ncbi:hypothetical protein RQP46_010166 [Phenoliferia psychrophenolica]
MASLGDILADLGIDFNDEEEAEYWCPPAPSNGRSPMSTLAPELLLRILALVAGDRPLGTVGPLTLVCHAWRDPCQALMWREIALLPGDAPYFQAMIDSAACGRHRTRSLVCLGGVEDEDKKLGVLLGKLKGVEHLTLYECAALDPTVFLSPTFADLKKLELRLCDFLPFASPITYPFQLSSLELTGDVPPHIASSLLSIHPTSLTLELDPFGAPNPGVLLALPSLAPTLRHLSLSETNPAYLPLFSSCTSLESIHLSSNFNVKDLIELLGTIPAQLKTLSIGVDIDDEGIDRLMADLKLKLVTGYIGRGCIEDLETLVVVFEGSEGEFDILPGAPEVERRCDAAGVKLVLDKELCDDDEDDDM